ncbi:pilus assembly protein PilP [Balneatrix alpica]|uniref:Pilus assembly protein PilP n=1 Tax=Balneatrix alpica TaxID=75684 RepID=A0ABV5ZCT1_9GAMM|nr:pilus assembly protein PilP [Balneatrix alpica]
MIRVSVMLTMWVALTGCSEPASLQDLQNFVAQVTSEPAPPLDPLPKIPAYQPVPYAVTALREPFTNPLQISLQLAEQAENAIKPDLQRPTEELEAFDLDVLSFTGLVERKGQPYAIMKDPSGALHLVTKGNYMGKNHGQIKDIKIKRVDLKTASRANEPLVQAQLEIEEIVPSGEGWRSRPRFISLQVTNND